MIPLVQLPSSNIVTSRVGFGTSRLSSSDRQRVLSAVLELGFIHFDTAPAYGDGLAEQELGRFLAGNRSRAVVVTKYGIPPDPILAVKPSSTLLRALRLLGRRAGIWPSDCPKISADGLRASVKASLRRLRTGWIDILLLHEPSPQRLENPLQLEQELVDMKARGYIRAFGLAGAWKEAGAVAAMHPGLASIIQTSEIEWEGARYLSRGADGRLDPT
jgi:aryl-alcohol dehydrogenase-like predicted oxidoreductase